MAKKITDMEAIVIWCKENGAVYADFQCMETLGYLQVSRANGSSYVVVKNQEAAQRYMKDIRH